MSKLDAMDLVVRGAFARLFWGKMVSFAGVWLHGTVAAIVVFQATGSAFQVGLVTLFQFAPQVLLAPYSGSRTDRSSPAGQMLLGRTICMVGAAMLVPWVLLTPPDQLRACGVLVASLVIGIGFALGGPAQVSIIPLLVERRLLVTATTLNSVPMTLGRILGPALGAIVTIGVGPAAAFCIAAVSHGVFCVLILLTTWPESPQRAADSDFSFMAGLRYVQSVGTLRSLLCAVAFACIAAEPAASLAPALAAELEDGPAQDALTGAVSTAFGLGLAIGYGLLGLVNRRLHWSSAVHLGAGGMALSLLGGATTDSSGVLLAAMVALGASFCMVFTLTTSQLHLVCSDEFRGRVMSMWLVAFIGMRPVAALFQGYLADVTSARMALLVTAAVPVALSLAIARRR